MEYLTYKLTLTEQELITLKTILEDTLHAGDILGESYEDAVIRGVIEQLTERYHHLKGYKDHPKS